MALSPRGLSHSIARPYGSEPQGSVPQNFNLIFYAANSAVFSNTIGQGDVNESMLLHIPYICVYLYLGQYK